MTTIRGARQEDRSGIIRLLSDAHLPIDDVEQHLERFFVAEDAAEVVGVGGFEPCAGGALLLRSFAVAPDYRNQGVGTGIFERICEQAEDAGASDLYLLTDTARDYFERLGFVVIAREQAPDGVRQTGQFARLCPASALLMHRPLDTGSRGAAAEDQDRDALADTATALFDSGYYCAESVLISVARERGISSPLIPAVATGFCGGLARTSGMCGALTGGVLALNMVYGRREPDRPVDDNYTAVQSLVRDFRARFGSTTCTELLGCDLSTPEGLQEFRDKRLRNRCRQFTAEAARMAGSLARS